MMSLRFYITYKLYYKEYGALRIYNPTSNGITIHKFYGRVHISELNPRNISYDGVWYI